MSNISTAFVAEWSQGQGGAAVGFLPEYDTLPGSGNAAEPRQIPGSRGVEVSHGCGHNQLGAGCTGAAIALKRMMTDSRTTGIVRVYGCAAEETQGAKVYMARDRLFDDLDAALAWHPGPMNGTGLLRTAAVDMLDIRFTGRSARAGVDPREGRSALKGAELFGTGIQVMREHHPPTPQLLYVYSKARETPNVVPDQAAVFIMIRDDSREAVDGVTAWVRDVAEESALTTRTAVEIDAFFGMHDLLPNTPLVERIHTHMGAVPIDGSDEEQDYARACQQEMGLPELGMAPVLLPILSEITTGGGTDVGDASVISPTGLFAWAAFPVEIGLHIWPVTASGGMSSGDRSALAAATIMAGVGYDVLTDPVLRDAARADFDKRKGGRAYVAPLPPDRKRPEGIPPHLLIRNGSQEIPAGYENGAEGR